MAEELRVSVRALVEFTLHGEDIVRPGGTIRDLQEGMFGHKGRQGALEEGWRAEVPLSVAVPWEDEDATLVVSGRMDAFLDGDVPEIEEIKLCQSRQPPEEPWPAHEMQAVCYGHMLCRARDLARVIISVAYVTRNGTVRARFTREWTAEACAEAFSGLTEAYLARQRLLRAHRRARDASLAAMIFPYDAYRAGQREMAAQVYTAIRLGRRLFASMPTGTGKSIAALFPALKALGLGLTGQVYYLTARTTQRQGALSAVARLRVRRPLHLWTLTLNAREKQCPEHAACQPEECPRAKGHFLRDGAAIEEMLSEDDWSPEAVRRMADRHCLCPFEFSLSLCEIADLVVCDYNYALDPAVHIKRIFDHPGEVTLLLDEAHNLLPRLRDMLGGAVDGGRVRRMRTVAGRCAGRRHPLYQAMTGMLRALDDLPTPEEASEGVLDALPQSVDRAAAELADAFAAASTERFPWGEAGDGAGEMILDLMSFLRARRREQSEYAWLWEGRKTRRLTACALEVGRYFRETTAPMRGTVCFSATLEPLPEMRRLLGGEEEDACFALPSPFPPERLLVQRRPVNTRYRYRSDAVGEIAEAIRQLIGAKAGRYIVFFPSFAFLAQTAEALADIPFQRQRPGMTDEERRDFLAPYRAGGAPVLSLCVLGGVFAEGIDLPGEALDGVAIVGVGLPQVSLYQDTLRAHYDETLGDGFLYAYMIPGMQKVAQAVGRVIRTENDRGVALLLDDRYGMAAYRRLCPAHWRMTQGGPEAIRAFWQDGAEDER